MPQALSTAAAIVMARDSPAPTDFTFTQYLSLLMTVWNDLFRTTSSDCLHLKDSDPLAPLLLPGAMLAAPALRIYAGSDGARIRAVNAYANGHDATVLTSILLPEDPSQRTPARMQQLQQLQQQIVQQAGRIACASVIANALRVADTFSIITYNATNRILGPQPSPGETAAGLGHPYTALSVAPSACSTHPACHGMQDGRPESQSCWRLNQVPPAAVCPHTRPCGL
jgi:hypothetical protein